MKNLATITCLMLFSLFNLMFRLCAIAQSPSLQLRENLNGIQIGQRVPDVLLKKVIEVDGTAHSAKLSDYSDKLLILDFMYTSCSSCVTGLVKKNYLQQKFGDKIKILVVVGGENYSPGMLNRENEEFIRNYLTSYNYLSFHEVKIPWVVENKELNNYFPHVNVSHLIWIYKGKLVAITEQDYVTADNIQLILDGKSNNWPVKNDFLPAVDVVTPLVKQSPARFNRIIAINDHAALFGTYQDGVYAKRGTVKDSINHTRRDYFINVSIIGLYKFLLFKSTGQSISRNPSQIILEVKNPEAYIVQEHSKVYNYENRQNILVSYEVNGLDKGQTEQDYAKYMTVQLNNLLGLQGRFEKRKMNCLVLCRIDSMEKFKAKSADAVAFSRSSIEAPNILIEGESFKSLVYLMNQFYGNPPVYDETGYSEPIDMQFTINSWTNITSVREAFQKYGLDLKTEEREVEVFILEPQSAR